MIIIIRIGENNGLGTIYVYINIPGVAGLELIYHTEKPTCPTGFIIKLWINCILFKNNAYIKEPSGFLKYCPELFF